MHRTQRSITILEMLIFAQVAKKAEHFMKTGSNLLLSQVSPTDHHPEPDDSSPYRS
jgi:hypothetical protein